MKYFKKALAVFTAVIISGVLCACQGSYDASGYTMAVLNLQFQGDTKTARTFVEGATQSSLMEIYQEFIDNFVAGYITDGMDISDRESEEFSELASTIFASMRYEVGEAKKTGKREYEVPVVIWPSDTFVLYHQLLTEDSYQITEKVQNGEYQGDEDEIQDQVMAEIASNAYELLVNAYESSDYGEKKTVILKVKAEKDGVYYIDEDDMKNLIIKILRLDEIGG